MMRTQPAPVTKTWFEIETAGEVTVLRFTRPDLTDPDAVKAMDGPMFSLVDEQGRRRFVMDFGPVVRMSSALLGKLITFQKKVKKAGGRLALCSLSADLHSQFERTRLDLLFPICPTEQDALQSVRG